MTTRGVDRGLVFAAPDYREDERAALSLMAGSRVAAALEHVVLAPERAMATAVAARLAGRLSGALTALEPWQRCRLAGVFGLAAVLTRGATTLVATNPGVGMGTRMLWAGLLVLGALAVAAPREMIAAASHTRWKRR